MLTVAMDEMAMIRRLIEEVNAPASDQEVPASHATYLELSSTAESTEEVTEIAPMPADEVVVEAAGAPDETDLNAPERTEDGRLVIYLRPGHLQETIRAAEGCLAETKRYFQRSGEIVTVQIDPATAESKVQALHPQGLVHALDGVSAWMRYRPSGNTWVQVDPPGRIANVLINTRSFERLPVLTGLARQPFLRPDGSLCLSPGHDGGTGMFGVFDAAQFDVPQEPTWEEAEQALAMLNELLEEVAFAAASDRSAALAALLTAVLRPSLALAPMFHVRAPQISSGKSYLCQIVTALATPQRGTPVGFPARDEECAKLLLAQLVRAPAVIEFDNLTSDLHAHKSLCTALTSERMEGRVLGHSKVMVVDTRALFLSSGNNVGPVADMTRRCLTIHLDPGCEVPAARVYRRPNLIADVRRERARYVSAALTVVRAWIVAGRPKASCPPLASFDDWSDWCRQPLLWLGQPDPAAAVFRGMAEDPERQLLGQFLAGWHGQFGGDAVKVRDVVDRVQKRVAGTEEFAEVLLEVAGDRNGVNNRRLGKWITQRAGRIVDGLRLVRAPRTRNVENWRVESVRSVESGSLAPAAERDESAV